MSNHQPLALFVDPPHPCWAVDDNGAAQFAMQKAEMLKFESAREWHGLLKSASAKRLYTVGMLKFCRHYFMTPDDLVALDARDPKAIKKMVKHYLAHLIQHAKKTVAKPRPGEYSVNSVPLYMAGVQSFTEHMEVPIIWKNIKKSYPDPVANTLRSHRRPEIVKLLALADIRERPLILAPVSSGMREAGKAELELRHLNVLTVTDEAVDLRPLGDLLAGSPTSPPKWPANSIGLVVVYGSSKKAKYITPSSPEAMQSYIDYFQYRRERGETIKATSPLIRDKFGFESKRRPGRPGHITAGAINIIMRKLLRKASLPYEELQPDHGLRKFFDTMAANAGVDYMFKEMYMGHSIKLDKVYYDPDNPESLRKIYNEYIKAVDLLTIDPKNRLQRENIQLKAQVKNRDILISKYELIQQEFQNFAKVATDSQKEAAEARRELAELKVAWAGKGGKIAPEQ